MQNVGGKRSYRRVKWLGAILLLLIVSVLLCQAEKKGTESMQEEPVHTESEETVDRIMVLGVDSRSDDVGRSDTLMVASVRREQEMAMLLSVPRDTRVEIKGHKYDKINHAYAYGGHELSRDTVEKLLGVPVDHYIMVDTKAFERIIDLIGGVDIDVEKRMYYEDPWDDNGGLVIDLYPGEQHLDGERAIQYVRYRDGEGDIGRIARQQKFVRAVLSQVISPSVLPKLPELAEEISGAVETDMSVGELIQMASMLKGIKDNGLKVDMVPGAPVYFSDISYWIPDIVALRHLLVEDLGLPMTEEMQAEAEKTEAKYRESLPKDVKIDELMEEARKAEAVKNGEKESPEKKETEEERKKQREEDSTPMKPEEISVMVINSSGIDGAGAEVAAVLQRKGFIISGVETGQSSSRETTTITTSSRNTDLFYGMPFPCLILDGGGKSQAVVNIGQDYRK